MIAEPQRVQEQEQEQERVSEQEQKPQCVAEQEQKSEHLPEQEQVCLEICEQVTLSELRITKWLWLRLDHYLSCRETLF